MDTDTDSTSRIRLLATGFPERFVVERFCPSAFSCMRIANHAGRSDRPNTKRTNSLGSRCEGSARWSSRPDSDVWTPPDLIANPRVAHHRRVRLSVARALDAIADFFTR